MKKILLTGASGFLGCNYCDLFANHFEIHAIHNEHPTQNKNVISNKADITDSVVLEECFQKIKPDKLIHLAAFSDPNRCELYPEISEKINIEASESLAYQCKKAKIPMIFSSTDLVFDGKSAPYKETDIPAPVNIYGLHKSIAEQAILDIYPDATICRLPLMVGPDFGDKPNFLVQMVRKFSLGEQVNLFTDEYRSTASARDVCAGLILCLKHPGQIFHLGGDERISRYDFGMIVSEVFGFDKSLIIKSKQKDVKMPAARPKDVSMTSDKAKGIGWIPGNLRDELENIKKEMGSL